MKTIAVVGAGTMGNGIAQVFAQAGFDVQLHDASSAALDRARVSIDKSLAKLVEKAKIGADDRDAALARIAPAASIDTASGADYVVEAIIESLEAKRDLFKRLDAITRPDVILTSNTSSISITALGPPRHGPIACSACTS